MSAIPCTWPSWRPSPGRRSRLARPGSWFTRPSYGWSSPRSCAGMRNRPWPASSARNMRPTGAAFLRGGRACGGAGRARRTRRQKAVDNGIVRAVGPTGNSYVHGYDARANERLIDQASALAELLHAGTRYQQESRVLEAGSGVGAQTITLATRSPGARFVSVDI